MAPRKTLLRPDRALPNPARKNRSHGLSAHRVSAYGESQARSHGAGQAGRNNQPAVG